MREGGSEGARERDYEQRQLDHTGACAQNAHTICMYVLKEAKGRAGTARSNQRSSNTLYCRVNVRVNDEMRRDSCSSSLINFVSKSVKTILGEL